MNLNEFERKIRQLGVLGYRVSQRDELIAQNMWDGDCRRNIYSASKSFTSCAVGIAIGEGLLSLEERLVDVFCDELPQQVSDYLQMATVRDLLTMCLGQERSFLMGSDRPFYTEDNWVKAALAVPFSDAPGTHFRYNNVGPYLAGILVQRRAGCDLVNYLMPRLFEPLGIHRPTWEVDPLGNTFGAGGLMLNLTELHKFGLLCLHMGEWNNRQLIPRAWMEQCTRPQDNAQYGYLFWIGEHHSYRADGKYAQLAIAFPEKDAVVSTISECRDGETLFRAIYDDLYPQL